MSLRCMIVLIGRSEGVRSDGQRRCRRPNLEMRALGLSDEGDDFYNLTGMCGVVETVQSRRRKARRVRCPEAKAGPGDCQSKNTVRGRMITNDQVLKNVRDLPTSSDLSRVQRR